MRVVASIDHGMHESLMTPHANGIEVLTVSQQRWLVSEADGIWRHPRAFGGLDLERSKSLWPDNQGGIQERRYGNGLQGSSTLNEGGRSVIFPKAIHGSGKSP